MKLSYFVITKFIGIKIDCLNYNMFCLVYSQMKIAAVTCTLRDLTKPCCGISTQWSIIGRRSQGMPSFSCLKEFFFLYKYLINIPIYLVLAT